MEEFSGLGMNLGNLSRLSKAQTRSISAENPTGEKGKGGMAEPDPNGPARKLGVGWKCRPYITVEPQQTVDLADIEGPGAIQTMWFTGTFSRDTIFRIYWENQENPSVECPLTDFFALPWHDRSSGSLVAGPCAQISSIPVAVNPNHGLNCFWEMPFRKHCRISIENRNPEKALTLFYQINYTLTSVPDDAAYFHAQFRRVNPLPYKDVYTIVDGIKGRGQYIGTTMGWGINNNGWWGEGEVKFYIDGDNEFPTICGTGTEDYFGGAYNWEIDGKYVEYTAPFMGMHEVIRPDGLHSSQHRHAMYRWHVADPIRFESDLRVTMQALGWRNDWTFLPGQHDICSVAFWYQTLPAGEFPPLEDRDYLEII